jgi:DNA-binding CsgD family transcriptional regulator
LTARLAQPRFLDDVLDGVGRIRDAQDQGTVCVRLQEVATLLGCNCAAFATFLPIDPWHQSYRFILACHPGWCAKYQRLAWFADDPWLDYARTSMFPARDSDIPCKTAKQAEIIALARSFGVASSFITPSPAGGGLFRLGVLMLGSSAADYFDVDPPSYAKLKSVSRLICHELHDWMVHFLREELLSTSKLSDADLTLLRHERAGFSSKEIARVEGISQSAIDSRFQRILGRLKVPSRRAAAQVAAEHGLL